DGIRDRNVTGVQTCALPISQLVRKLDRHVSRGRGRPLSSTSNLHSAAEIKNFLKITMGTGFIIRKRRPIPRVSSFLLRRRLCDRSEERRVGKERRWMWSGDA